MVVNINLSTKPMKNLLLLSIIFIFFLSSCEQKKKYLTPQELEAEKEKIKLVIQNFNQASEDEDFGKMVEYLSDEVTFFGTDSSEIIKTFAEYKKAIDQQWQIYDRIHYSDLNDVTVFIDREGSLATIFYGSSASVLKQGITKEYYLRGARILEKKDDKWLIVGGLTGIVRSSNEVERSHLTADSLGQP